MEPLVVDGSHGEGGGQILRTAVAFSMILRRPVRVTKIRAGRSVPGLRPQHVASLNIVRQVSGGRLEGATVGSSEISFTPGNISSSSLFLDMKTAASITLALQAVIPAVALSGVRLELDLVGGTDVPWSPPFDYLSTVIREGYRRLGIGFTVEAGKRGYYPVGGGHVKATIGPCEKVRALELTVSPPPSPVSIMSRCGRLPRHVAERQATSAASFLELEGLALGRVVVAEEESDSPGSSILLWSEGDASILGADAIGAKGRSAESVGKDAARKFVEAASTRACVGAELADMLAPLLSLADGVSRVRIPSVTSHLTTSLHVASLFTSCSYDLRPDANSTILSVTPANPR